MKESTKKALAGTAVPTQRKGYTLSELRYQMALTGLKAEFCKEKLINTSQKVMGTSPLGSKKGGSLPSTFISSILKGLSYADYIMMGWSIFKTSKNVLSLFKKTKNK